MRWSPASLFALVCQPFKPATYTCPSIGLIRARQMPVSKLKFGNFTTPPCTIGEPVAPGSASIITRNTEHVPYDRCSMRSLNGPHLSVVSHPPPPLELSTSGYGNQQTGSPKFVGGGSVCER